MDCSTNSDLCFVQVEEALQKVHLTGAKVEHIREVFHIEMERGIHEQPSSLQMENTYIPELPNGTGN
jgi:hexokinase